ncbi:MAG: RidA family protein [Candidatus Latescibacterota bacterium]
MLVDHPQGGYRFLPGIDPYSCGVVAAPQHQIVRALLARTLPWQEGLARAETHLLAAGRPRSALCGVELRSPAPFTMAGFVAYNAAYCRLLRSWGLYVGDANPVARTNVAPADDPPREVVLHAFSYTTPEPTEGATFVVAGAGELCDGVLDAERILQPGRTDAGSMRQKASYVMQVMEARLRDLGGAWEEVSTVDVYTVHLLEGLLEEVVLPRLGIAGRHGVRWHRARPPVVDIEFEMDLRGVRRQIVVD